MIIKNLNGKTKIIRKNITKAEALKFFDIESKKGGKLEKIVSFKLIKSEDTLN